MEGGRGESTPFTGFPVFDHPDYENCHRHGDNNMNTTTQLDRVEKIASSLYLCSLAASPEKDALFQMLIDLEVDGPTKPLLVVGSTHPHHYGDGYCIAVLNPDQSLFEKILPGCGISDPILKWLVRGKCDLALQLWINTIGGFRTARTCLYKSRQPSPARVPWRAREIGRATNRP